MYKKIALGLMLSIFLNSAVVASSLSYMIKNDTEVESYLKIKNNKENVYLQFSCNNVYNDIEVTLRGLNEKNFYSKNFFDSKLIFKKKFTKGKWSSTYSKNGDFYLKLEDKGFQFAENIYNNTQVLIDLPELGSPKLYSITNKDFLRKKMSLIFENCSIYF